MNRVLDKRMPNNSLCGGCEATELFVRCTQLQAPSFGLHLKASTVGSRIHLFIRSFIYSFIHSLMAHLKHNDKRPSMMPLSHSQISLPLWTLKLLQSHPCSCSPLPQHSLHDTSVAARKITILGSSVVNYPNSFRAMAQLPLTWLTAHFWNPSSFQMQSMYWWFSQLCIQPCLLLWAPQVAT